MAERHALLIVNRACRQGRIDLTAVLRRLQQHGLRVTPVYPDDAAAAARAIRAAAADCDRVIVAGGDGTLHGALEPLLDTGLALGILPLGTANDLARSLGLPRQPLAAADVIGAGRRQRIDVGRVNGCPFFNAASIGLGVKVTRELSGSRIKERWGPFSYARALLAAMRDSRAFRVRISVDHGSEVEYSLQITVGNGRYYGGGMTIAAGARVDDGRLFLYSIRPQPFWRLARLLPALRRGRHGDYPEVLMRVAPRLRVETTAPMPITADGELCARTPALFEVEPAAIPVFVPDGVPAAAAGRQDVSQ